MVTPLARRRPWKLARETATLDHLSGGRLTLGVGLGGPSDTEFAAFGEPGDLKTLAGKLDEGLEVLCGLWSGEPFSFSGQHYRVDNVHFLPRPVQQPRIPVWVGCMWPRMGPVRRAARWDGMFPIHKNWPTDYLLPDDYREIGAIVRDLRKDGGPFDLAATGAWQGDKPGLRREVVAEYEAAGVTWWLQQADSLDNARRYAAMTPPR
jgi:alkanesulfonate monooxygenase SsuD/methylene tetrahydromethanopterin reductase-like flavin-dependent oxidoreductase (luciferase family)